MVSAFIGSRLFHVLYENPEIYRAQPLAILYFWNGGFVFYGGALFAVTCGTLFAIYKRVPNKGDFFDLFAPVASLAYALGRWGCFFEGCCYGQICDLPWAINQRHPTQIYASVWEFGVLSLLIACEKNPKRKKGQVFFLWMTLHGIGRVMMESFRDDFRGPTAWLSVSSWISLAVVATGLIGLMRVTKTATHQTNVPD